MKKNSADKIAAEIHDQFLPNLMSIIYELEFWKKKETLSPAGKEFLNNIKNELELAVRESRKFLLYLKPPKIIESSLPKALNHYLKRLEETKGLNYKWVTPAPDRQTYVSQDVLLLTFLELLANLPLVDEEILFSFKPDDAAVNLSFSWSGLTRSWLSKNLKSVIMKRLIKAKGEIRYCRAKKRLWLVIFLPQRR
ncbi:MAG: hypothetical protein Q7J59_04530 [Elusimicrobiota bacterium]|nr:hypothetical protein [Elusimicrobiota bacterium]